MKQTNDGISPSLSHLPEGCVSNIISLMASPIEAGRASLISWEFKSAAESDFFWEQFFPEDYKEIISSSDSPPFSCSTKKELFSHLCHCPILINNGTMTNLIKGSIRMGYNDFGDFYYAHGSLAEAFKSYVRTRDYCTTSKHIVHMCLNAILVSIEMGQFTHVTSYVSKAEQSPDAVDAVTSAKLHCAAGLAHLEGKKYKLAARKFLETGPELGNNYTEVIAAQDVATYGGLCALATFDRTELKSKVIDNSNFRNFLELVPEIRELIQDFYTSHYASCLEYLGNLKANLFSVFI